MRTSRSTRRLASGLGLVLLAAAAIAGWDTSSARKAAKKSPTPPPRNAQDLQVVDCLPPGQVRQLGRQQTYVSRRRPVRTTALDCGIRGGEYVAYDRADYRTALHVWLKPGVRDTEPLRRRLGELGLAAESFEFVQPSLEDVFMDVVAREEAAAV